MISDKILRVAVVGVGEIAMVTHLPTLALMSHMFETVALVDISKDALAHCSSKFRVTSTFTDVDGMLAACPEVDVVMIMNANEYHTPHAIKALRAGKHVFIEKPVAMDRESFEELESARLSSGKMVFVGYMRRYATAFLQLKDLVKRSDSIKYVKLRDMMSLSRKPHNETGTFPRRFTDFPEAAEPERLALSDKILDRALGDRANNPADHWTWRFLNMLVTHDVSLMRELIGMPKGVIKATRSSCGRWMVILFDYETFVAVLETGVDQVGKTDTSVEVFTDISRFKLAYDSPYIKGVPITLTVSSHKPDGDFVEAQIRPTYEDPYTQEMSAMYEAINSGVPAKTTTLDALDDLTLFEMVLGALHK